MSGVPLAIARIVNELIDVVGEKALVALLDRLLLNTREAQLKANYEAGKRIIEGRKRR